MSEPAPHPRCAVHGLASGPDGGCVLCRREAAPPATSWGARLWVAALALLSLAVGGTLAWKGAHGYLAALREPAVEATAEPAEGEVRLFVTPWCPHCKRAERWLEEHKVAYTLIDVEKKPAMKREHRRLNPRGSVPTLDVGGKVVVGFDADEFRRALRDGGR